MTSLSFNKFFPENVATLVSDGSVDFKVTDGNFEFNDAQKLYLSKFLDTDIDRVINVSQVHGNKIVVADKNYNIIEEADGIVTNQINLPIVVRTADCLPVFLYDRENIVISVVHAGWKSTFKKIVVEALRTMCIEYQTHPNDVLVAFGPSMQFENYEVGEEFLELFPQTAVQQDEKIRLDIPLENKRQLLECGIHSDQIYDCQVCTYSEPNLFSYRRDGDASGRMLSLMMLKG